MSYNSGMSIIRGACRQAERKVTPSTRNLMWVMPTEEESMEDHICGLLFLNGG